MGATVIVSCPKCSKKLRFPSDKGLILVTCPVCGYMFQYKPKTQSDTAKVLLQSKPPVSPAKAPVKPTSQGWNQAKKPVEPVSQVKKPAPTTVPQNQQQPTRTVSIRRGMHAYKDLTAAGLKNMFVDAAPVAVYLDGEKQGMLNKDKAMVLRIDSGKHIISQSPISSKHRIPEGSDSYDSFYFNGAFMTGPVNDPFRDELAAFILKLVRGQGFRDRINDPNNHYHAVEITIQSNYVRVHWRLNQTKGFAEWSTGEKEEKIYYHQAGLTPLPEHKQPSGYWSYLNNYIRDVVVFDPKADLEHVVGGFAVRKTHSLY